MVASTVLAAVHVRPGWGTFVFAALAVALAVLLLVLIVGRLDRRGGPLRFAGIAALWLLAVLLGAMPVLPAGRSRLTSYFLRPAPNAELSEEPARPASPGAEPGELLELRARFDRVSLKGLYRTRDLRADLTVYRPGKEARAWKKLKAVTDEGGWGSTIEVTRPGVATAPILRKVWVTLPKDKDLIGRQGKLVLYGTVLFPVEGKTADEAFVVEKHKLREEHSIWFATAEAKRKHRAALAAWAKEHKRWDEERQRAAAAHQETVERAEKRARRAVAVSWCLAALCLGGVAWLAWTVRREAKA